MTLFLWVILIWSKVFAVYSVYAVNVSWRRNVQLCLGSGRAKNGDLIDSRLQFLKEQLAIMKNYELNDVEETAHKLNLDISHSGVTTLKYKRYHLIGKVEVTVDREAEQLCSGSRSDFRIWHTILVHCLSIRNMTFNALMGQVLL